MIRDTKTRNITLSLPMIEALFIQYNMEYFNGYLPIPRFEFIHSHKILGEFSYQWDMFGEPFNPVIRISDGFYYPDHCLKDILVHEMIHFYLAYTKEDKFCTHGKSFKRMSDDFNLNYNMNIEVIKCTYFLKRMQYKNIFIRLKEWIFRI